MFIFRKILFLVFISFFSCALFAQEPGINQPVPSRNPSATVRINETQYALILSGSSGTGTLTYKGLEYPFRLRGMSVGPNVGVSKISATGEVYDLVDISKFPGKYSKMEGSVTLALGGGGSVLKNENGVIINLTNISEGIQINVSAGDVIIEFTN